jgi:PTS system mannose-specific IIA component
MIGLVLVTHGRLAEEFVCGARACCRAAAQLHCGVHRSGRRHGASPAGHHRQRLRADEGDGVVVLTDMFGGTPSNLAISIMDRPRSK